MKQELIELQPKLVETGKEVSARMHMCMGLRHMHSEIFRWARESGWV